MLHVFPFSSREGTVAAKMPNQIDAKIKKERCAKLVELSDYLWDQYIDKDNRKEVEVLIEQYDEKTNSSIGHTSNYLEVRIPNKKIEVGSIYKTKFSK